jgi:hypothetical protein
MAAMNTGTSLLTVLLVAFMFTAPVAARIIPEAPAPGNLVINEILARPDFVLEALGEWFEVKNLTGDNLNLNGCSITDGASDSFTINTDTYVSPGGYLVLCVNSDFMTNGGLPCDYQWSNFRLNNMADSIIIVCSGQEIDRVDYATTSDWPILQGASIAYNLPDSGDPDNNLPANWQDTPPEIDYGDGNAGTPGQQNHDWMDGVGGPTALTLTGMRIHSGSSPDIQQAFLILLVILTLGLGVRTLRTAFSRRSE